MMTATDVKFEAPGAGPWELDAAHFDRPFPRYARREFAQAFEEGQALWFERVGVPMKGFRAAFVNGFFYAQIVPIVGEAEAGAKLPPRWLFRLLCQLHPTLRKRASTARRWLESRGWRQDVEQWDSEVKPGLCRRFTELQAEALASLEDAALVEHLERATALMQDNFRAHFNTNPTTIYPVGTFVAKTREWTGATPAEVLDATQSGASAPGDQALQTLVTALRDSNMSELPSSADASAVLERLRAESGAVGEAARAWLQHVEPRVITSGDLSVPIGAECPELLVEHIRHALTSPAKKLNGKSHDAAAKLRARVPQEYQAEFDELLSEARLVHRLRDERSTQLDCWALGLVRRALIECARRLVERRLLQQADHVVDLEHEELIQLLLHGKGPSAADVAERVHQRTSFRMDDAPEYLGTDAPDPPPPLDYFDPATGALLGALFEYVEHMDRDAPEPDKPQAATLTGLPASSGKYRGPARVVTSAAQFATVQPGDVLVTRATMPAYNVLLPIVGAIVTDKGGALCHAAIVSREYGLPAVVGTRDATSRLTNGTLIEVDGDTGSVQILSEAEGNA